MQPTSVFAAASSRLHTDLIVIRLKRAGIPRDRISVIYPERRRPNCALCWLNGEASPQLWGDELIAAGGPLSRIVDISSEPALVGSLRDFGLSHADACNCADLVSRGQTLVAVQAADEAEIAIAWPTFRQLEAERIASGLSSPHAVVAAIDQHSSAGEVLGVAV